MSIDPLPDLERGLATWRERGWPAPYALVVSGSGLAVDLGEPIAGPEPLAELLPFETHAVEGHPLSIELLEPVAGRRVAYQRGRLHAYQGYHPHQVVFMVRLARLLGAEVLLMTHAAGGLSPDDSPGALKLVTDHLNLTGMNPLTGELPADWGPRFPDMGGAYDPALGRLIAGHAERLGIDLGRGIYAGLSGPSYETPAEVRMLRAMGADTCGMSTVQEVIAARQMGMRCGVVSLVSNLACGVSDQPLDHEEVLEAGQVAAKDVRELWTEVLADPEL